MKGSQDNQIQVKLLRKKESNAVAERLRHRSLEQKSPSSSHR